MKYKVIVTLLCVIIVALLVSSCIYKAQLDEFPTDNLPIYQNFKVIEYEYDEDGKDIELEYGSQDDIKKVCSFYEKYFKDNNIEVEKIKKRNGYTYLGRINNYLFELEIEEPSSKKEKKFGTIVEIELEYTGKSLPTNEPASTESEPATANLESSQDDIQDTDYHLIMGKDIVCDKTYEGTNQYSSSYYYSNLGITLYKVIAEKDHFVLLGRTDSTEGDITRKYGGHYDGDLGQDGFGDAFLAKVDSSLNIIWIQYLSYENIDPNTTSDDHPIDVKKLPDGTYEVTTRTSKGEVEEDYHYFGETVEMISTINSDGKITSCKEREQQYSLSGTVASYEAIGGKIVWKLSDKIDMDGSNYYTVNAVDTPTGKIFWLNVNSQTLLTDEFKGFHTLTMPDYNELYDNMYDTQGLWDDGEDKEYQIKNMHDVLVVKLDKQGVMEWYRYCGGTGDDIIYGGCEKDGKYYFKGYTASVDYDVVGYSHNMEQVIIVSTDVIDYQPIRAQWYFTLDNAGNLETSELYDSSFDIQHNDRVAIMENRHVAVIHDENTIRIYR